MSTILLVEDDRTIAAELTDALSFFDYRVIHCADGYQGLQRYREEKPDLLILDVMLPGVDGFEVLKKIRAQDKQTPVIMLTAKSLENDKLLGFELGVDDYVVKPFSLKELAARIKVALKRRAPRDSESNEIERFVIGDFVIQFKSYTVSSTNGDTALSPKEADILKLFVSRPGEVVSRQEIIDQVWGDEYDPSPRTVDNFILKLRSIFERDPKKPHIFVTVHGAGYKLHLP